MVAAQRSGADEHIAEFAHVAGPGVPRQLGQGRVRAADIFRAHAVEDIAHEQGDIPGAFGKRREMERHGADPVVKILAERAGRDHGREVAVGGGDKAKVHLARAGSPEPHDPFFFQHPEQLDLCVRRQIAYFVQKQRAPVRQFDLADLAVPVRSGKRARRVAEDFRFKQFLGNGRAIETDERAVGSGARPVDGAGGQFLAGSGGPEDENGRVRPRIAQQI